MSATSLGANDTTRKRSGDMRDELALRHLLLRQIWVARKRINHTEYDEVSSSLVVTSGDGFYRVEWSRDGTRSERTIEKSDFSFYVRGDSTKSRAAEAGNHNLRRAQQLALELLGLEPDHGAFQPQTHQNREVGYILWSLLVATVYSVVGAMPLAACFAAAYLLRLIPRWGRLLAVPTLGLFAVAGHGSVAVVTGLASFATEFLDPNPELRRLRVLLAGSVVSVGVWSAVQGLGLFPSPNVALLVFTAAIPIAIYGSLTTTSGRVEHLLLPVASIGFVAGGHELYAGLALALSGLRLLLRKFTNSRGTALR